jgi:hypothetical protein
MGLAAYQAARREFFSGTPGAFSVQGLSLEGIAILVREHLSEMEPLVDLFINGEKAKLTSVADKDFTPVVQALVSQAPGFAANVIAVAAGEPDAVGVAATIPGPLQIEILVAIGELTFSEVGGVKKSWETVASLLSMVKKSPKKITKT